MRSTRVVPLQADGRTFHGEYSSPRPPLREPHRPRAMAHLVLRTSHRSRGPCHRSANHGTAACCRADTMTVRENSHIRQRARRARAYVRTVAAIGENGRVAAGV